MGEAKFKAPKAVMDELNRLRSNGSSIYSLLSEIKKSTVLSDYENYQMRYAPIDVIDQAIIDYVIWGNTTFELKRAPHYVIVWFPKKGDHDDYEVYVKGKFSPLTVKGNIDVYLLGYEEGWNKKDAEKLNEVINGQLQEVK